MSAALASMTGFARAEGSAVLAELARRYPAISLSGPPEPQLNNTLRALGSLPLAVSASRG